MVDMRFSFGQMTSNQDGKTSGSGTMGILICTIGAISFLLGVIDKLWISGSIDVITQSIIFVGIGAALLGYRKGKEASPVVTDTTVQSNMDKPLNS